MVYLYYCQACEEGKHKKCELITPMQKGCISGGRKCKCPCSGDPLYDSPERIHKECMSLLKHIERADRLSRNSKNPMKIGKRRKKIS